MSLTGSPGVTAASALPPEVREGTKQDRDLYRAAQGFERALVGQLTQALAGGEQDDEAKAASGLGGPYGRMLPETLAESLSANGGTGLAEDLYRALRGPGGGAS